MQKMPVQSYGKNPTKKPEPGRLGPKKVPAKPYKGGGVLENMKERLLPRRGPGGLGPKKKQAPGGMLEKRNEKLKKAYGSSMNSQKAGSSLNNMKMQKAGPAVSPRNTQKGGRPTLNRNKQAPNFKGVFQGLAKPKPKTVPTRRGR
jgi:hypothetical protein